MVGPGVAAYSRLLERRPIPTKALTSGVICFLADLVCQLAIDRTPPSQFDRARSGRLFLLGAALTGPAYHLWYQLLAGWFPGSAARRTLLVLFLDQGIFAPLFNPFWMACLMAMERRTAEIVPTLRCTFRQMMLVNWAVWLPSQIASFTLIPLKWQVLFMNGCSVIWSGYCSWANAKQKKRPSRTTDSDAITAAPCHSC